MVLAPGHEVQLPFFGSSDAGAPGHRGLNFPFSEVQTLAQAGLGGPIRRARKRNLNVAILYVYLPGDAVDELAVSLERSLS